MSGADRNPAPAPDAHDPETGLDDQVLEYLRQRDAGTDPESAGWYRELEADRREDIRRRVAAMDRVGAALRPPPLQVPGYRIEGKLGEGAVGTVWGAWDETLERPVALKLLRRGTPGRILEEARRAAAISHPALVTIHSVAELDGNAAIVMERVAGEPIDRAARGLGDRSKARVLLEVARGLAAAHGHGIIHRDLKPENVLVSTDLRPKILDFGLAVRAEDASRDGVFEGTPLYASPEQAAGEDLGAASDVFSFGALMYKVLTGTVPFDGEDAETVLRRIRTEDPPFPRNASRDVPAGLQAICLACMAHDPTARPTAAQVAADLGRWIAGDAVKLRPALYGDVLRDSVARRLEETADWETHGMISPGEGDRLHAVYRRILADEDHWILDARRLSPPQALLNAGTWLVVVAVTLLVWLARDELSPLARWLIPTAGFAMLLAAGFVLHLRREVEFAAAFLAGAVLVAVPAILALLSELGLLADRPRGIPQLLESTYSNDQIFAACAAGLALSVAALWLLRFTALAWTGAALASLTWVAYLLTRGWLDLEPESQALWCLPLVLLEAVALGFEAGRQVRWALPFHLVALVALVACLDVIAVEANTLTWLGLEVYGDARDQQLALALNGLLYLVVMVLVERAPSLDLRRSARIFELLALLHLFGALYRNARDEQAGWAEVSGYLGAVAFVLLLSPWRSRRRFLFGALVGLALGSHLLVAEGYLAPVPFLLWLGLGGMSTALLTWFYLRRTSR
jgi:serine/threonine protein kinase